MYQQASMVADSCYRSAGTAAVLSGVLGMAAFGLLMDAVFTRVSWIPTSRIYILFGAHDIGVALQFLLLIPVLYGLRALLRQSGQRLNKAIFATGVGATMLVVLLVLLGIGQKVVSNGLYMLPQGIFGVWLMLINWRLSGSLPGWLRWLGEIVGLGLVLVGASFVGICFIYPSALAIPAVRQEDVKEVSSAANTFIHQLLVFSSFMGVATLPLWTVLTGFQLHRRCVGVTKSKYS